MAVDSGSGAASAVESGLAGREAKRARTTETLPWIEKYRPKNLSDLVAQDDITSTLDKLMSAGRLPHLLFYGPPGTGKTSTILACARKLFGEQTASMVLELNASDNRGIGDVRDLIKPVPPLPAPEPSAVLERSRCRCPGVRGAWATALWFNDRSGRMSAGRRRSNIATGCPPLPRAAACSAGRREPFRLPRAPLASAPRRRLPPQPARPGAHVCRAPFCSPLLPPQELRRHAQALLQRREAHHPGRGGQHDTRRAVRAPPSH